MRKTSPGSSESHAVWDHPAALVGLNDGLVIEQTDVIRYQKVNVKYVEGETCKLV